MPANPPRAPGELAEIEAIIRRHIWARVALEGGTIQLLGFGAAAAEIASLRSATGDGGEAKEAGAPFTPNYSAVAEPEYRYQEPDNRACSMIAQPRSTKIKGASDNA